MTFMKPENILRLYNDLKTLLADMGKSHVACMKAGHVTAALSQSVNEDDVRTLMSGLERAYGIVALQTVQSRVPQSAQENDTSEYR